MYRYETPYTIFLKNNHSIQSSDVKVYLYDNSSCIGNIEKITKIKDITYIKLTTGYFWIYGNLPLKIGSYVEIEYQTIKYKTYTQKWITILRVYESKKNI